LLNLACIGKMHLESGLSCLPDWCRLCRLRGHRDQITALKFLTADSSSLPSTSTSSAAAFILSGSKDTFLKLWDLTTQHCVQTVVAHRMEIWSLDLDSEQSLLFTGSGEGELKAWKIDHSALQQGISADVKGEVTTIYRLPCPSI
jgi:U3 small nucleolar RNA-associated protein 12